MSKLERIRWELSSLRTKLMLKRLGITAGPGLRALGQPIVSRTANSGVTLGARIVLTSRSSGTALGVRAPVILRTLAPGAQLEIGDDVGMSGAVICAAVKVTIGRRCLIGADCMIFDTDFHGHEIGGDGVPYRRHRAPNWGDISAPVSIGDDVFLGARTTVCKGVKIGSGSIVAAGSVVTRDIPENCVAAGSPAKFIRWLETPMSAGE